MLKKNIALGVAIISCCVLNPWHTQDVNLSVLLIASVALVSSIFVLVKDWR